MEADGRVDAQGCCGSVPHARGCFVRFRHGAAAFIYAGLLLKALRGFLQSDAGVPEVPHFPRQGYLEAIGHAAYASFRLQAVEHVRAIWEAMRVKEARLPLGHDGYLKLWALSDPELRTEYILVDEAQDLNPVLLGVLGRVQYPLVFVGDPYQQIYDWRGAINAMDLLRTRHQVLLSQSFRFGPEIASAATMLLRLLGAKKPLRGSPRIDSHLARVRPDAILSRSNAGVVGNVLDLLRRGISCAVLGGTGELGRLQQDVQRIKGGLSAKDSDLLGFATWRDVVHFSRQPEGEHLRGLVYLVQEHGEDQMLSALSRCEQNEASAQVVCSTAHHAKGREWAYVRVDPDFEAAFVRAAALQKRNLHESKTAFEAEVRLLYVAITRSEQAVHLPLEIRKRFGLRSTSVELLGKEVGAHIPRTQSPSHSS